MVREEAWFGTQMDPSHAMFAGPGASRASSFVGWPLIGSFTQERDGLASRSGMDVAILLTVLVWDKSRDEMASAAVTWRTTWLCPRLYDNDDGVKAWMWVAVNANDASNEERREIFIVDWVPMNQF